MNGWYISYVDENDFTLVQNGEANMYTKFDLILLNNSYFAMKFLMNDQYVVID